MLRSFLSASIFVFLALTALSQEKPAAKPAAAPAPAAREAEAGGTSEPAGAKLPVRRVVLYKNGVGYFEHLGRVRGNQSLTIDFTSGQLNDVLSSLTVLDLGGGKITAVNYNSEAPLAKRLGALRLPLGEQTTVSQFLNALRGARLEVRSGGATIAGRLLSVEKKTRTTKEGQVIPYDEISLITDAGEVRTAELGTTTSVRMAERDLNQEVGRYLNLIASTRLQDLRRMTISSSGAGDRQVYVSYISEVPLWKTTYRIVMPSKANAKPLLQGWAIVDNTVGEDWENVELSLVAGAPQSFIQQLSQPYYSRRPVVPLPESVQLEPQTHAATLIPGNGRLSGNVTDANGATVANATVRVYDANNNVVATATTDESGDYEVNGLPEGNYRVEVQSAGFRSYSESNVNVMGGEEVSKD
ncbi:MAG TPA: carboxypeptidase-like regulatory domain-containing protein, partial [Candidatus Solibacter sp.]|nr:carboxypeptidase-like regulatory domain-containing protein [Candidatus Solibacter sp.]